MLQSDSTSLLDARRRENAQTPQINSSLFVLHVAKDELTNRRGWYEAGKIHQALSGDMLRSKSEVIIANLLHERKISSRYEQPLFAGTARYGFRISPSPRAARRISGSISDCSTKPNMRRMETQTRLV